jgi:hypothetical protein
MADRRPAGIRRVNSVAMVEREPPILSHVTWRLGLRRGACKPACTLSEPVGSLLGIWQIDTWSEPS